MKKPEPADCCFGAAGVSPSSPSWPGAFLPRGTMSKPSKPGMRNGCGEALDVTLIWTTAGETFSKIFKGIHDLELKYGDTGAFFRGKYWYDFELKDEHREFKDIDDSGRKITSDRPIPECVAREQRLLSRSEVHALQAALNQRGFPTGQPDGVAGPATRAALRAWQRSIGVPADGFPTLQWLQRLQASSAP